MVDIDILKQIAVSLGLGLLVGFQRPASFRWLGCSSSAV
jgi:hypothetical protein